MFFKKKKQAEEVRPETEEIEFHFPLYVNVYKPGFDEESGDEPIELTGTEAYEYIEDDVRDSICDDFAYSELHRFFEPAGVVFGFSMEITEDGAIVRADVIKGISDEVKESIKRFLDGQMSDGWGESSDQYFRDDDENSESYEVYFWKYAAEHFIDE